MVKRGEMKDFYGKKLSDTEIQKRFVKLEEFSEDEINQMLEEARKNEIMIRAQIQEIRMMGKGNQIL